MSSFADLFNPSFFIFLGILVLTISLLVVYFESKNREQTQKITAMFSVISSLADEVNNLKVIFSQPSLHGGSMLHNENEYMTFTPNHFPENILEISENKLQNKNVLISVSDDEDSHNSEDDTESSIGDDLESVSDSESEVSSEDLEDELAQSDVKVLKLNVDQTDDLELEELEDADDLEDIDDSQSISSESSVLSVHDEINVEDEKPEPLHISSTEFKTININLEEPNEPIDYKKFSLQKLKSVVAEKGLSVDISKLKKNELLKLLGVE
jgi:hypothetical protein